ncbi:failed axon connections homolog isoform X2 [Gordionus sp. m RMFG-2023]|uniref:failed axon connections homolog isoform X2 n=1 Tax=Gordionus sp. m RMFG-2023 TaxID=3053472 RepID=UPI0031FD2A46
MSKLYETGFQAYRDHETGIKQTILVLGGAIIVGHGIWYLKAHYFKKKTKASKDIVILHQIPRAKYIPNLSYHSMKIETFLRMANISYENELSFLRSPRGYIPWVEYKGSIMGDSQIAIDHLSSVFDVNLNLQFSDRDRAQALAFRILTENHLYCEYRWKFKYCNPFVTLLEYSKGDWCFYLFMKLYGRLVLKPQHNKRSYLSGVGKFNEPQVYQIGLKDLKALSSFLGGKTYIMGEQPSEVDCCVFSMLAQILYSRDKNPYAFLIEGEFPNLSTYCARMKKRYWEDWDQCCTSSTED